MAKDSAPVHEIQLQEPIQHGGQMIAVLQFQPLRAGHLRDIPATGLTIGHVLDLAGKMSGLPPSVVNQLGLLDLRAVADYVGEALAPFQGTGAS